ncbi:unnamed protein product [Trifolium pratense]|uniref:Uncharacterized protein n=1 Tax=Trifolium pratense TaxID=57577 RepID=A0ACB0IUV9_TRIPR|nr:unnamed protein product [Trifolium pratense]
MSNHFQKTLSLDSELKLDFDSAFEIPNPNFLHPQSVVQMISSCRGFIFSHHSSKFQLWNPSIGAVKQIPLSPNELNNNYCFLYGFGYDQLRDDYLVVSVSNNPNSRLEFFSLRDNTWKEIEGTGYRYFSNTRRVGLVFNGGIHWVAETAQWKNVILAFDLMERKLLEMPYPDGYNYNYPDENCGFWVYGEFISLWVMGYDNQRVEI